MKLSHGIVVFALVLAGCNNNHEKEQTEKINTLHAQDSTLTAEAKSKDSLITNYVSTMGDIEDNLDSLKRKERILSMSNPEARKNPKGAIMDDIKAIDRAIIISNRKVSSLESKLRRIEGHDAKLKKMIDRLTKEIAQKDSEITMLQGKLGSANDTITAITRRFNDTMDVIRKNRTTIHEMTTEMNTVYYTIGTMKQLKGKGVITKTGGVLGIGRTSEVSASVRTSAFTKGDKTQISEIPLHGKLLRIVTSHPAGSYKITPVDKKNETLVISDPANFWSESKYLVVEIK